MRGILAQDFEKDSEDNGYLLAQISRRYDDGDGANVGAAVQAPQQISELSGAVIQQAAQRYLDHGQLRASDAHAGNEVAARLLDLGSLVSSRARRFAWPQFFRDCGHFVFMGLFGRKHIESNSG